MTFHYEVASCHVVSVAVTAVDTATFIAVHYGNDNDDAD